MGGIENPAYQLLVMPYISPNQRKIGIKIQNEDSYREVTHLKVIPEEVTLCRNGGKGIVTKIDEVDKTT